MWRRDFGPSYYKRNEFLFTVLILLTVIGLFAGQAAIFTVIGLYAAYFIVYTVFDRRVIQNIVLNNPKQIIRLFPGEDDILRFDMENKSIFPTINGQFRFQTDSSIYAKEMSKKMNPYWNQYHIPFSLAGKGSTMIELPIHAKERGTARIRNVSYTFPHLFHFDKVNLHFTPFFKTEVIVYPKPKPVKGIESVFEITPGSHPVNFSPFEDIQNRMGTRNYHYSDSFQRINWKASAKTQKLQTNVYEKVIDISYVFIVNISTSYNGVNMVQFNRNLENVLSYTAFLCKYATEKGFPFEMFINARKPGKVPFFHLQENQGQTHFGSALEMLARIQRQAMVVPFDQMLHRIGRQFSKAQSIIVIGDVSPRDGHVIQSWTRTQKNISHLKSLGEQGAVLTPWKNSVWGNVE